MNLKILLDQCLAILHSIKDDRRQLKKLLEFMQQEFCEEEVNTMETVNHLDQVSEKYRATVKEIADNMSAQLISFVDAETLEVDAASQQLEYMDIDEHDSISEWEDRIKIEPLDSHDSYEIMGNFVAQLPYGRERERLSEAINGYKPFANFNRIIHQSEFRENWFEFRQKELEKFVTGNCLFKIIKKHKLLCPNSD
jgi:hypothetical protein